MAVVNWGNKVNLMWHGNVRHWNYSKGTKYAVLTRTDREGNKLTLRIKPNREHSEILEVEFSGNRRVTFNLTELDEMRTAIQEAMDKLNKKY